MRGKTTGMLAVAVAVAFSLPVDVDAQARSWKDVQVADIETMKDKFVGLARAFDESQYDWRPMEGVRSVREVLALTVAEAHLFPGLWGAAPPAGAAAGFEDEMDRVAEMPKATVVDELTTSFDFLTAQVRDMSEEQRMAAGSYFGTAMPNHAVVSQAMADMHEHLGQLIAYARSNRVVPPWSR